MVPGTCLNREGEALQINVIIAGKPCSGYGIIIYNDILNNTETRESWKKTRSQAFIGSMKDVSERNLV